MHPLRPLLRELTERLAKAGVSSPRVDAELLAEHVLGVPRGELVLHDDIAEGAAAELIGLVERRAIRVPLQHLTGTAPFLGLDLQVGPGVFVPRPETELLAAWGVDAVRGRETATVVDLCAGSGALALAVAAACPSTKVYAVEAGESALPWLRGNVARLAAGGAVVVVAADATSPGTLHELDGTVDLVLSNPPYVPSDVAVPPEVAEHDPPSAVFAGPDGLAVIRPLIQRAAALLRSGGLLGVEHDETHRAAMPALLAAGFTGIVTHPDLTGRPRYTTAIKS